MAESRTVSSEQSRNVLNRHIENRGIFNELAQGHELEILKVLDLLDRTRQKWAEEIQKNALLRQNLDDVSKELDNVRHEFSSATEQLRDARAQIAALVSEKQDLELECAEMERKFQLVKEVVKPEISHLNEEELSKLAFLNNTASLHKTSLIQRYNLPLPECGGSQDGDVDYDGTEDATVHPSFDNIGTDQTRLRNGKVYRRSEADPFHGTTSKRLKSSTLHLQKTEEEKEVPTKRLRGSPLANTSTLITTTTTVAIDAEGNAPTKAKVMVRRSVNRSFSESELIVSEKQKKAAKATVNFSAFPSQCGTSSVADIRTPSASGRNWMKGCALETRSHTFTNYTSIIYDYCDVCSSRIGIGCKPASRCIDCNLHVHKSCTSRAIMPCIPRVPTPRTPGKQRPRLKDFCPAARPMIPHIIVHCVIDLERYHINSEGLYRVPGQESQIIKLLNGFKNTRFQPKLRYQDPETITGCIKRFLNQLRDSLIPSSSWEEFVAAAAQNDPKAVDQCIIELPIPNRDTLAFLCRHFQKVCENSTQNKVTREVLARSIAPTIVGRSPMRTANYAQGNTEATRQIQVMLALLNMPCNYWSRLFYDPATSQESTNFLLDAPKRLVNQGKLSQRPETSSNRGNTKLSPSAADRSILGPIRTPPSGAKGRLLQPAYQRKNICLTPY